MTALIQLNFMLTFITFCAIKTRINDEDEIYFQLISQFSKGFNNVRKKPDKLIQIVEFFL